MLPAQHHPTNASGRGRAAPSINCRICLYHTRSGEGGTWPLGVAMAKSRTGNRKSQVAHFSPPVANLGQTNGFSHPSNEAGSLAMAVRGTLGTGGNGGSGVTGHQVSGCCSPVPEHKVSDFLVRKGTVGLIPPGSRTRTEPLSCSLFSAHLVSLCPRGHASGEDAYSSPAACGPFPPLSKLTHSF